jgi:23S rRNA (adenine2503-C2)-methyltransferase
MGLLSFTRHTLSECLKKNTISKSHCKTIFTKIYKDLDLNIQSKNLPQKKINNLLNKFSIKLPIIHSVDISELDQSVKFILKFFDNKMCEAVLIPEKSRTTVCLSTQIGCAQKCSFCATGKMGLLRNLSHEEIVAQLLCVKIWSHNHKDIFKNTTKPWTEIKNIVFMGMGEPLDNYENLAEAIKVFSDPWGFNLAPKKITVSTVGHLPGLKKILDFSIPISLAISIHAANDKLRSKIMPINRKYPLSELIEIIRQFNKKRKCSVLIQYILLKGVNDSSAHAQELIHLLKDVQIKVNLIPYNTVQDRRFIPPDLDTIKKFQHSLLKNDIRTMVRFSKGSDIMGACGQLYQKSTTTS